MHDMLFLGLDTDQYDHLQFSGVVPRTFIGSLVVCFLSAPLSLALRAVTDRKIYHLYVVRFVLAGLVVAGLGVLRRALAARWQSQAVGRAFALLLFCQFHTVFYASRPLPNSFAMIGCCLALAAWLRGQYRATCAIFAFTTIVLRCDVILLAGPVLLVSLLYRRCSLWSLVSSGLIASACAVALTVGVDSWFWRRWLWPELEVLLFNTVENKSHLWGTQPAHWYFTSALPRGLLATLVFVPFGLLRSSPSPSGLRAAWRRGQLIDHNVAYILLPAVMFVSLYSLLPHKELRFLFPALPLLTAAGAVGLARLLDPAATTAFTTANAAAAGPSHADHAGHADHDTPKVRPRPSQTPLLCMRVSAWLALLASFAATLVFLLAAAHNYPGGDAFASFHHAFRPTVTIQSVQTGTGTGTGVDSRPWVHIGNLAATTGVSRFGQEDAYWRYSKEEGLSPPDLAQHPAAFEFLIAEAAAVADFADFADTADTDKAAAGSGSGSGSDSGSGSGSGSGSTSTLPTRGPSGFSLVSCAPGFQGLARPAELVRVMTAALRPEQCGPSLAHLLAQAVITEPAVCILQREVPVHP